MVLNGIEYVLFVFEIAHSVVGHFECELGMSS
jgi:hypothetical protein